MVLPAGTMIRIGAHNANRIPELWGPDGDSFRPERWFDAKNGFDPILSAAYKDQDLSLPGVWSNMYVPTPLNDLEDLTDQLWVQHDFYGWSKVLHWLPVCSARNE